ncbi:proline dehydrogenase family protein [Candidatus Nitrospira bockiana]
MSNDLNQLDIQTLESDIMRIGRDLAERSAGLSPTLFERRWWSKTLLDWAMKDEAFKVRLFRFIDVLPSLRDDAQVARLVEEYFGDLRSLGAPLQWGMRAMSATKLGARLSAKSLRQRILQMATIFIAGATVERAEGVLSSLWKEGRAFSIDLLGEACVSEVEADQYRDRCLHALETLAKTAPTWPSNPLLEQDHLGTVPRINLSVKLSALYSQLDAIDPEGSYHATATRLRPLLDLAQRIPASVTFDMEQAELKDLILEIFMRLLSEEAYRTYPYAGIALQAYLKDSAADLERLLAWTHERGVPISIRLVKGAYWDSETIRYQQRGWPVPVFESKAETDANYERLTRRLFDHVHEIRPAIGTHNLRSLAYAEATAKHLGVPSGAYEYQMIFGMAEPLQMAVAASGRRLRLYTPVGELIPGMAYLVRRLLENTSNESFLRKEYSENEPLNRLLSPPHEAPKPRLPATPPREDRFRNEPHTDFSKSSARRAMQDALAHVRRQFGRRHVPPTGSVPASGEELTIVNPGRPSEIIGVVATCSPKDTEDAVQRAREAWRAWREQPPGERAAILQRTAEIARRQRFELAAWEVFETGKPWREADADVAEAIDFLEFYAREMRRLGEPRRLGHEPGELNELLYEPRGVAAVIAPWNFPLAIPMGMVSASLVTGNAVVFKPSERAILVGLLLSRLFKEAGLPSGVLQVLPGGPAVGRLLTGHAEVDLVAFTGSKDVGLGILRESVRAAEGQRNIKRVIAEMGGKNAIIIDDTADLDEAVVGVIKSFTGYQGQKCSACSRAIVHDSVYELFLKRLAEAVMSLKIGPPEDPGTVIGPMIDARARAKVREYIEIGKQEGRVIVARDVSGPGYFVGPAVFSEIRAHHRLAQEEIFGPVLAVMRARDFDDALALANESCYALTGGVYSRSPANIARARRSFDVGNLYINRPITGALVARQPFGGHRLSGIGAKAGGEDYLGQFMITRVVSENTLRRGFAPSEF